MAVILAPNPVVGGYWLTWTSQRLSACSTNYNLLYLSFGIPSGSSGAVTISDSGGPGGTAQLKADIATVRARGVCVILSIGGATASPSITSFNSAATVTAFVNSISTLMSSIGPFDGLDWDIEDDSTVNHSANMISASQQLRALYPNFVFTWAGADVTWITNGPAVIQALNNAGLLNYVGPMCYEGVAIVGGMNALAPYVGSDWSKMVLGTWIGSASNQHTLAEFQAGWTTLKAAHPTIRGGYVWDTSTEGGAFSNTMAALIRASAPSPTAPIADSGGDQTVQAYDVVTLDGTGSSDPDGTVTGYLWRQISGSPAVTLSSTAVVRPTFKAPGSDTGSILVFGLIVTDNTAAQSTESTVTINVNAASWFAAKAAGWTAAEMDSARSTGWDPAASLPGAPTAVSAVAGSAQATVSFVGPGGSVDNYRVTSTPGGFTMSGVTSPLIVTGLTNGTTYTFKAAAHNIAGWGPDSAASNSVTPAGLPGAPTNVTAVAGNAQATITFTGPGGTIDDYRATSTPGGFTVSGAASPLTVTGLTNNTAYTFKVAAHNAVGWSVDSAASNSITPMGLPAAPTSISAAAGNAQAVVSFIGPGGPVDNYRATSTPGSFTASRAVSPITVTGLTNGTPYTFKAAAHNPVGWGPDSAASNSVTPTGGSTHTPGTPTWLKTVGNQIQTADTSQTVILRGVNMARNEWQGNTVWEALAIPMLDSWGGNFILRGFAADPVNSNNSTYMAGLDYYVSQGMAHNMHVAFVYRSDAIDGAQPGAPTAAAKTALPILASRYKNNPNVMFGLTVEPYGVTWATLRPTFETMVDNIRTAAAPSVPIVLIPGENYSQDISGAVSNPVNRTNIIYKPHCYQPASNYPAQWENARNSGLPVLIGEMAPAESATMTDMNTLYSYCQNNGVGWAAWWMDYSNQGTEALCISASDAGPTSPWGTTTKTAMLLTPALP